VPQLVENSLQFDHAVIGPADEIKLAAMLILTREDLPNGSTFAVSANARPGERRLYLSNASKDYLQANSPLWAEVWSVQ
jgi:hypothetical protein